MRAENCVGGEIEHISFHWDAPMFYVSNTNTYQEEIKNIDHMWHVYANPLEPVVCPLVALTWYIIAPPINYHWSKKFVIKTFPIRTFQQNI